MHEESIFAAALERADKAVRRAFLDEACAGDPALRRRVERLIEAHERTLGILDGPAGPPPSLEVVTGAAPRADLPAEHIGTVVAGRYKLLAKVGEGGMGTVWAAEQTQPVRRKVALKLLKAGMDSRNVLARFEAERQALALMDHPNIAKVLDGGVTERGRPYFVMEYVEGLPITRHCDEAHLSVARRLELFVAVCQAVQHAHTKGVIHRDLKPSNILVCLDDDGRPVPKVIDFGLAKALHQPLTDRTLHTAHDALMGTPLYMSPEQAGSKKFDVDARADVYALGVILYELLTGTTPLEPRRFREAGWDEMFRLIREEEPPRPSARLSGSDALPSLAALRQSDPSRLARLVRGDLDWIVMKCLEKDRARRYDTASGLARDVQRYLADESVEASPPSARYRLAKFVRRNRGAVLTVAAVFLLLLGVVVGTSWGLVQAERAWKAEAGRVEVEKRSRAQTYQRLKQVEKGSAILTSVFADLDPDTAEKEGKPLRAVLGERLVRAAEQLQELEGDEVVDALSLAGMQNRLAVSMLNLGIAGRAIPLFEKARAARAVGLGPEHPETLASTDGLARSYQAAGKLDRAVPLLEEVLRSQQALLGVDHPETLKSMNHLGSAYRVAGKVRQAVPLLERNLKLRREKLGPDDPSTLSSMNSLAAAYQDDGKHGQALELFEQTLKLRREKLGPDHGDTLVSLNNLASSYQDNNRVDLALPLYEEAFERIKAKLGPDHPNTLTSMSNLAIGYRVAKKFDRAAQLHEEALKLRRAKLGPRHPDTLTSMTNLASVHLNAGKPDRAVPLYEEAFAIQKAEFGPEHASTVASMSGLGSSYRAAGRLDRAIPLLEESLRVRRAALSPGHPLIDTSINNLALAYRDAGQLDRALPLLTQAATAVEARRFKHAGAPDIVHNLAEAQEGLRRFDEAESWRRKWLAVVKERTCGSSLEYAAELSALGVNLLLQERWADAEAALRESLAVRTRKAPEAWETALTRASLGRTLLGQGRYAAAEPLLVKAYEDLKAREDQIPLRSRRRIAEVVESIIRLYEAQDQPEKAAQWRAKQPKADAARPQP